AGTARRAVLEGRCRADAGAATLAPPGRRNVVPVGRSRPPEAADDHGDLGAGADRIGLLRDPAEAALTAGAGELLASGAAAATLGQDADLRHTGRHGDLLGLPALLRLPHDLVPGPRGLRRWVVARG